MEWSFLYIHIYQGYVKILLLKKKQQSEVEHSVKWFSFKSTDRILEQGLWFHGEWPLLTSREGILCHKGVCRERNRSQKVMNSVSLNHAFSSIPATSTYCFATFILRMGTLLSLMVTSTAWKMWLRRPIFQAMRRKFRVEIPQLMEKHSSDQLVIPLWFVSL